MFQHTAARRRLVSNHVGLSMNKMFQHTAARRRLGRIGWSSMCWKKFQHTAARRRLGQPSRRRGCLRLFQHTAARRRLGTGRGDGAKAQNVSTHSRPKAAGFWAARRAQLAASFNTQPPEGGWQWQSYTQKSPRWFQHTAARRRLAPVLSG